MKFTQTGTFQKNTLDKLTTLNPKERINEIFLDKLDYFIGFLAKEKPEIITDYIKNLTKKYKGLIEEEFMKKTSGVFREKFTNYENLKQYPNLNEASLNYLIYLLQLKDKSAWETAEVEISKKSLIQAWTYPSYYLLETLAETIDRKEAVNLYKRYITNYYIDNPSPERDDCFSLEKMLEKRLLGDTTSSEWVIVHTMLEEGKHAFKNENCPTCVDTMIDLPDVEIKHLVSYYGDYEKFRAIYSDHIILTMEHTLMEGNSYCSRVLHDTRIDYDLRHPSKEFWDNFKPGNEEEAMKYYKICYV